MPLLRLIVDGKEVKRCEVSAPMVVGRGEECDLRIVDAQVSRLHCRIEPSRDGWVVVDLGSHNGTLLGGKPVDRQVLRDGDQLEVGSAILQFESARLSAELAALQKEMAEADPESESGTVDLAPDKSAAEKTDAGTPTAAPVNLWRQAQRRSLVPAEPSPVPVDRGVSPGLGGRYQGVLRSIRRVLSSGADQPDQRDQPWYRRRIPLHVGATITLLVAVLLYFLVFGFPTFGRSSAPPPRLPHSSPHNND